MFRKLTEHSKTILYSHPHVAMFMAGFVFFLYRMFFLPGFNFNARLWDEEIGWEIKSEVEGCILDFLDKNILEKYGIRTILRKSNFKSKRN